MRLSVILKLAKGKNENKKTFDYLLKENTNIIKNTQLLLYGSKEDTSFWETQIKDNFKEVVICLDSECSEESIYAYASSVLTGDYITVLNGGDVWSANTLEVLETTLKGNEQGIVMLRKSMPENVPCAFAGLESSNKYMVQNLNIRYMVYPFFFGGTFVKFELFKEHHFRPELGLEMEREFFLTICAKEKNVLYIPNSIYYSAEAREGDITFYKGIYDTKWYEESFRDFWLPFLETIKETYGKIPVFIQYNLIFSICSRITSNLDNKNKHVIEEGREQICFDFMAKALQYVSDDVMLNMHKLPGCEINDTMKWLFGILKYGNDFKMEKYYLSGQAYYGFGKTVLNKIANLKTNMVFMDYKDGYLEIDGTIHPILYAMADEVYFSFNGKKYELQYNERYTLTKVFGVSVHKTHAFHVTLPMKKIENCYLYCYARIGNEIIKIAFKYDSHFSRLSEVCTNSYWTFGDEKRYIVRNGDGGIHFKTTSKSECVSQEFKLLKELFFKRTKKDWIFILIRLAYFVTRPILKKKPIWMYLDKIYKGGDSSEYLYRYASKQKNDFRHYYLIDKKTSDYKRLKKDGFKPLVRGSIMHRLVFLMADMMVISNSTVFAFNNFGMKNSSYIRDLVDFHVCCVQHGMSVQKIAIAQNRLRDNTRLYFCASEYEIENLSRPVYDYIGYDALKLTGVPRYDGLVNNDKKQIMISPTWRMQAAVPVRTSEGEQRDYNPMFKESTYYKVFNSLINDPRLIEAAKKYGYKIKYVLHPIVSAQKDDFDKNDYVDIVPAVGDMSYEQMFCESSLMVTDFSGIQFDFAYMRKPLVYLHHKDIPQHYEEGTFFYDTMAFGEICHDNDELIDLLCEYMANGCQMKEEYVRRADDFFYYDDHNNCERIYKEMVEYQNKHILHKENPPREYTLATGKNYQLDTSAREKCLEEFANIIAESEEELGGSTIADSYFNKKIKNKTVLVVGLGKNVRGSMQYILNELNHNDKFDKFKVYVRTSEETDPIVHEYIRKNQWERTETVVSNKKYRDLMESAKYLITEVYFPESWIKKEGQVYINIWHGTPLKKLGLAKNSDTVHKDGVTQRNFIEADYLLYPNQYTKKHMLESYKVSELMEGKSVMLGYPRTGGLLEAAGRDLTELKKQLAPNGETIYAYMPTWKDYLPVELVVMESKNLLSYLDKNLRDDQILYVNLHHKVSDSIDYSEFKRIRKFPATTDNYELLATTDALITDYSSVFYDYLALRRQIILYCADYELYREKRGTYMDLMELPFDKARTKEAVLEALNRGKTYDDHEAYETFCAYDSVDNAKHLCSLLLEEPENIEIEAIPKQNKKNILIYSDSCRRSKATDRLRELTNIYDTSKQQIYIGCEMSKVDSNKGSAYPMLADTPVIGTKQDPHLSAIGKVLIRLYQQNKISFAKAMEYLQYDYALVPRRMFGRVDFDVTLIYDVQDPERIISLAMMPSDKLLFLNKKTIEQLEKQDEFLKEAILFAIPYVRGVFVESDDQKNFVERTLGSQIKPQIVENAKELQQLINKVVYEK